MVIIVAGAIMSMSWIWLGLIGEVPDTALRLLMATTYWMGVNGLLYMLLSGVVFLWINTKLFGKPDQIASDLIESFERGGSVIGCVSKWYVIIVGALVPLLYALQAFGVLGDPWLPTMMSDWLTILIYLLSQVPILLIALASLQIRWIYGVGVDDGELCCNFLWVHQRVILEKVLFAGKFGRLIFVIPGGLRLPVVVLATPP